VMRDGGPSESAERRASANRSKNDDRRSFEGKVEGTARGRARKGVKKSKTVRAGNRCYAPCGGYKTSD